MLNDVMNFVGLHDFTNFLNTKYIMASLL